MLPACVASASRFIIHEGAWPSYPVNSRHDGGPVVVVPDRSQAIVPGGGYDAGIGPGSRQTVQIEPLYALSEPHPSSVYCFCRFRLQNIPGDEQPDHFSELSNDLK